jgi:hypothetical protein
VTLFSFQRSPHSNAAAAKYNEKDWDRGGVGWLSTVECYSEICRRYSWGEPRNLGAPVNGEASEFFPTLTKDGTLYFGSGR